MRPRAERTTDSLGELIDATAWIDTHEHLVEERLRLGSSSCRFQVESGEQIAIPGDWTALITQYVIEDMVAAGLSPAATATLLGDERSPVEKWDLAADALEAVRGGGYMRAVDLTTERLLGLRLSRDNCESAGERLARLREPGYYRRLLREVAGVEHCQVHSLDADPFCESDQPDLLRQDLAIAPLVYGRHDRAERQAGIEVATLDDYLQVVEWCFEHYGRRAVAVKCFWAYHRPLAVSFSDDRPEQAFARLRAGSASEQERLAVGDYLFARCLDLATANGLPVKLHLGTLAGNGEEQLRWVRDHVNDVTPIVQRYPDTQFVLMHAAWPHCEELLALAKHQPNVVVDLCWSWILAPLATVEFVRRFLTTAPVNKLLCFGGDYLAVENVVGHAELARRGLGRALTSLVEEGWMAAAEVERLVPRLMAGNAERIFPIPVP